MKPVHVRTVAAARFPQPGPREDRLGVVVRLPQHEYAAAAALAADYRLELEDVVRLALRLLLHQSARRLPSVRSALWG